MKANELEYKKVKTTEGLAGHPVLWLQFKSVIPENPLVERFFRFFYLSKWSIVGNFWGIFIIL